MENKTEKQNIIPIKKGQGAQFLERVLIFKSSSEVVDEFLKKVSGTQKDEAEKVREKIKLAQIGLRRSRDSYVEMEIKKSQYWSEVSGFFGKSVEIDLSDPEIAYMREIYQKAVDYYIWNILDYIYVINYDMASEQLRQAMINEIDLFVLNEAMILFEIRTNKMTRVFLDKFGVSSSIASSFAANFGSLKQKVFDTFGISVKSKKVKEKKEAIVDLNIYKSSGVLKKVKAKDHKESYFTLVLDQDQKLNEILINTLSSQGDKIYEHHEELKGQDARQIVKRMLNDWYYENMDRFPSGPPDLVHKGSVVVIDLVALRIISIHDSEGLAYSNQLIKTSDIQKESFASDIIPWTRSKIEIDETKFEELEHQIVDLNKEIIEKYDKNNNNVIDEEEKLAAKGDLLLVNQIKNERKKLKVQMDALLEPTSLKMAVGTLREAICGGELNVWRANKDKQFAEVKRSMPIHFRKKLQEEISKLNLDHRIVREKRGETFEQWTRRIGYLIWENKRK